MRKVDPATVYSRLERELEVLSSLYRRGYNGLRNVGHADLYRGKLAEITFHKSYVAFEIFASELFIGLINREPANFQSWMINKQSAVIANNVPAWLFNRLTISSTQHLPVEEVREALDPKRFNVTFRSAREMRRRANQWLSAANAAGILSLSVSDRDFINCSTEIRNYIAHESQSAHQTMNSQLIRVNKTGQNPEFARTNHGVNSVGAYLRAKPNGTGRVLAYITRLRDIGDRMKP